MAERVSTHPVEVGLRVLASAGSTGVLQVSSMHGIGWIEVAEGAVSSVRCPSAGAGSLLEQIVEMLTWTDAVAEVVEPRQGCAYLSIDVEDLLVRAELAVRTWDHDQQEFCAGGRRLVAEQSSLLSNPRRLGSSVSEGRDWVVLAAVAGGADDLAEVACQLRRGRAEVARSIRRLVAHGRVRVSAHHPAMGDSFEVGPQRVVDTDGVAHMVRVIRTQTKPAEEQMPAVVPAASNVIHLDAERLRRRPTVTRRRRTPSLLRR